MLLYGFQNSYVLSNCILSRGLESSLALFFCLVRDKKPQSEQQIHKRFGVLQCCVVVVLVFRFCAWLGAV